MHRERGHCADANHECFLIDEELGIVVRRRFRRVLIFRGNAEEHIKARYRAWA